VEEEQEYNKKKYKKRRRGRRKSSSYREQKKDEKEKKKLFLPDVRSKSCPPCGRKAVGARRIYCIRGSVSLATRIETEHSV